MNYDLLLEYFGVTTGLLYLILEVRQHRAMWVVGFLTSLIYVYVFFSAKIYADMTLNLYYIGISIYGFLQWSRQPQAQQLPQPEEKESIVYKHVSSRLLAGIIGALAFLDGCIYLLLDRFTDSPFPSGDAFTTAVGIVATWMLARRLIEHWYFWVVVNFVSVYLYYLRGLYPTMFLYACYGILAVVGYCTWKKKGEEAREEIV